MKVLLATDGSQQANVALQTAVALLPKERVEFDLVCVAPEFTQPKAQLAKDAKKRSRMIEYYGERILVEAREMLEKIQASLGGERNRSRNTNGDRLAGAGDCRACQ